MLAQLGRKFGAPDDEGIALTFEPAHGELAEMIGCSRPMVSRLIADLIKQGEIARRGRLYILLNGGAIAAMVRNSAAVTAPRRTFAFRTSPHRGVAGEQRSGSRCAASLILLCCPFGVGLPQIRHAAPHPLHGYA